MTAWDEYLKNKKWREQAEDNLSRAESFKATQKNNKNASLGTIEVLKKEKKELEERLDGVKEIIRKMNKDVFPAMQKADGKSSSLEGLFSYSMRLLGTVAAAISIVWGSKKTNNDDSVIDDLSLEKRSIETEISNLTSKIREEGNKINTYNANIKKCDKLIKESKKQVSKYATAEEYWRKKAQQN